MPSQKPTNRHGFFMPAEWEPHERTWMAWPARKSVWGDHFQATKPEFAAVAHAIRQFEPLTMVVNTADEAEARSLLGSDIELLVAPIDDSWARDSGPSFLIDRDGGLAGVDLTFNAWGGNYHPYDSDDALAARILESCSAARIASPLVGEGGGICVDGRGTMLTTESCLLNANRNPDWSKAEVEAELMRAFGVTKVIWLPGNGAETETDGHIDGIAMFVDVGTVILETVADRLDPGAFVAEENLRALQESTDAAGNRLRVVVIEDASSADGIGDKFCRSYVNFYFTNGGIIMPKYGIPADDKAREALQDLHPDREVVQLEINNIAIGGGGIHCITQQQPCRVR